jgi:malate permease and related proteins
MTLFLDVVTGITIPLVLLIGFGFLVQKRVGLDAATLGRLVVYGTLPALLILSLSRADLPLAEVQATVLFTIGQFFLLMALGWGAAVLLRLDPSFRPVVALAAPFANTGNYGIPVVELAFGATYVPHQAIITTVLSVLILGLSPFILASGKGWRASLLGALRTPVIPAIVLGLGLNALDIALPRILTYPLELVAGANTPVALIALGAQLGAGTWAMARAPVALGVTLRLVVGPLVTWAALLLLGLPEGLSDLLLVGAGLPVGILLPIFCAEYGTHARSASAMVAVSTALSPVIVTILVFAARAT